MARSAEVVAADNAAVVARLGKALENPGLSDIVLISELDGSKTPAATLLLASCSPMFTQMLTGAFAEGDRFRKRDAGASTLDAGAPPVSCAFSGEALASVVAFAATNDAPALWSGSAEILGEILEAADYYDIGDLRLKAMRQLVARVRETPEDACAVLQAVWDRSEADELGGDSVGEVVEAALTVIDDSADAALMGCACLCEEAMWKVLSGQRIRAGEVELFKALLKWVSANKEERETGGKRLVSFLALEEMPPSFLADEVEKSDLVSQEVLSGLFRAQALKAEVENGFHSRSRRNHLPGWESTECVDYAGPALLTRHTKIGVEFLNRYLGSGRWAWDLRVEGKGGLFAVGVLSGVVERGLWLGHQRGGYAYQSIGKVWEAGKSTDLLPSFTQNDVVHVFLDCDAGTLSFSVNDGPRHEAFTGMNLGCDRKKTFKARFRPAVSLSSGRRVRLLKFEGIPILPAG